ncbi:hypothetical protein ACQP1U_17275 [Actinomycetota bacterium]
MTQPPAGAATLARAASWLAAEAPSRRAGLVVTRGALEKGLARVEAAWPDPAPEITRVQDAADRLAEAYAARFGPQRPAAGTGSTTPGVTAGERVSRWLATVEETTAILTRRNLGLGRRGATPALAAAVADLLAERETLTTWLRRAARDRAVDARGALPQALTDAATAVMPGHLPGIDPLDEGDDIVRVVRGRGPLTLGVGGARVGLVALTAEDADGATRHEMPVPSAPVVPLTLDLEERGGFITNAPAVVESALARLIALLPPGGLEVTVVDTGGRGAAAGFLAALGPEGASSVAASVHTREDIARELDALGGQLDGDEGPLRVLFLVNPVTAFAADGPEDDDLLDRLERVVTGGRVPVIGLSRTTECDRLARILARLPHLVAGRAIPTGRLSEVLGVEVPSRAEGALIDPRLAAEVTWVFEPPVRHTSEVLATRLGLR